MVSSSRKGNPFYRFKVQNLPQNARANDLQDHYRKFGQLVNVQVVHDHMNHSRSIAYLVFMGYPAALFDTGAVKTSSVVAGDTESLVSSEVSYSSARQFMNKNVRITVMQ